MMDRRWRASLGSMGWALSVSLAHAQDSAPPSQVPPSEADVSTVPVDGPASAPSVAPPPTPSTGSGLGEIVVTAQKRAESLQDVPIALSALSEEDIANRQITSIGDIAAQTAGFEYGEVGGAGQVSIRGVGFSLFSGAGENSVAIHADGVYLPQPASSNMMYEDLGRIEVLRGPQGTLYGRNATAGVLNLISIAPPAELEFGASYTYARYDESKVKVHAGDGLFGDRLRVRLAGAIDKTRDDLYENVEYEGRDMGARDLKTVRFNADLDAASGFLVELRTFLARDDNHGPHYEAYKPPEGAVLAPPGTYTDDPYTHRNNDEGRTNKDLDGASLRGTWDLSDHWSLSSLTGYSKFRYLTHHYDGDGTSNDLITVNLRDNRDRSISEELLLSFDSKDLKWLVGGYYLDEKFEPLIHSLFDVTGAAAVGVDFAGATVDPAFGNFVQQLLLATPIGGRAQVDVFFHSHEKTESLAFFTDVTWTVVDDFRVYGGIRHTDENKKQNLLIQIVENETRQGLTQCRDLVTKLDYKATTGRVGIQYDLVEDSMVYAQFARGFKAGGFAISACGDTFEPEEIDALEVGFKSTVLDHRLRLNGAAYDYDYKNLQVEEINLPNAFVNNAQAKVKGAELELQLAPSHAWEFSGELSYLDAQYTEFSNDDNSASIPAGLGLEGQQDLAGNRLNRSPRWTYGGAAQYSFEAGRIGSFSLRADATHKSNYYLREFNTDTDRVDAHTIWNGFVNWFLPWDGVAIRAFGKNLTNEKVPSGLIGILGYKTAAFDPPHLWGLSVEFEFQP